MVHSKLSYRHYLVRSVGVELMDRATDADLGADGHDPETIAMLAVPGHDLLGDFAADSAMEGVSATTGGDEIDAPSPVTLDGASEAGDMSSLAGSTVDSVGFDLNEVSSAVGQLSPAAVTPARESHAEPGDRSTAAAATTPEPAKPMTTLPRPAARNTAADMPSPPKRETVEGIDNPMRVEPEARVGGAPENSNAPKKRPKVVSGRMNAPPEIEASEPPTNEMPPTASAIAAVESASEPGENHDHLRFRSPLNSTTPCRLAISLTPAKWDSSVVRGLSCWGLLEGSPFVCCLEQPPCLWMTRKPSNKSLHGRFQTHRRSNSGRLAHKAQSRGAKTTRPSRRSTRRRIRLSSIKHPKQQVNELSRLLW